MAWTGNVEGNGTSQQFNNFNWGMVNNPNLGMDEIQQLMAQQHEYDKELKAAETQGAIIAAAIGGVFALGAGIVGYVSDRKSDALVKEQIEQNKQLAASIGSLNTTVAALPNLGSVSIETF